MNHNIPKIAVIGWLDSATHLGWHREGTSLSPKLVLSTGWVLMEDADKIQISSSYVLNGDYADPTVILQGSISFKILLPVPLGLIKWLNSLNDRKEER